MTCINVLKPVYNFYNSIRHTTEKAKEPNIYPITNVDIN